MPLTRAIRWITHDARWASFESTKTTSNRQLKTSMGTNNLTLPEVFQPLKTMEISARAAQLTPSLTLSIDSKAKAMKAEGLDVCGFGAGEPDFDTPEHIKAAAIASLEAGFTKYTPSSGIPELRQAIADKFLIDNGIDYKPSQIIVSDGAKHSCYNAILATCQPGDEVIIPSP